VKWERVKGRTAHVGAGDRHLAVPLAWAVLLLFHPAVGGPVYDSLVDDRSASWSYISGCWSSSD
jgi:hypothetical protein